MVWNQDRNIFHVGVFGIIQTLSFLSLSSKFIILEIWSLLIPLVQHSKMGQCGGVHSPTCFFDNKANLFHMFDNKTNLLPRFLFGQQYPWRYWLKLGQHRRSLFYFPKIVGTWKSKGTLSCSGKVGKNPLGDNIGSPQHG